MPTLNIELSATASIGGETLGPDIVKAPVVGETVHDKVVNVPGAASATYQTIWDSSVDSPTTFTNGVIIADPKNAVATEHFIDVRKTINAVATIERVSTFGMPLTLGPSAQGTGATTKIEVANKSGGTVTTDDVLCRITLWK